MNIKITPSNQKVLDVLFQVHSAVLSLNERGIKVLGVSTSGINPVIRIERHACCEQFIRSGKACYQEFGNSRHGYYKQGIFMHRGCRVYWSESIH